MQAFVVTIFALALTIVGIAGFVGPRVGTIQRSEAHPSFITYRRGFPVPAWIAYADNAEKITFGRDVAVFIDHTGKRTLRLVWEDGLEAKAPLFFWFKKTSEPGNFTMGRVTIELKLNADYPEGFHFDGALVHVIEPVKLLHEGPAIREGMKA